MMNGKSDVRYTLAIQAGVTLVLIIFAAVLLIFVPGSNAETMGTVIVTAVVTHWFKESSSAATAARKAEEPATLTATIKPTEPPDSYETKTVRDLRKELKKRQLGTSGNKEQLIERLREDDRTKDGAGE